MNNKNNGFNKFSITGNSTKNLRPLLEGTYAYILAVFIGYMGADLTLINLRSKMLPEEAPPTPPTKRQRKEQRSLSKYRVITKRNIFNEDGIIPKALASDGKEVDTQNIDGPATLTSLPIELKGTIVHRNPRRSVATIISKGRSNAEVTSFRIQEEVNGLAEIIAIQRRKVIFKNLNNGRKEYIEMPEGAKVSLGYKDSPKPQTSGEITQIRPNEFTIKRSEIMKYTSNFSQVLRQARMVPNTIPGSDEVEGFRFVSIQPNSIYEKLGFKVGDIIRKVNGEPVNSPTKAMELYNALQTTNRIQINLERNGNKEDNIYSIID